MASSSFPMASAHRTAGQLLLLNEILTLAETAAHTGRNPGHPVVVIGEGGAGKSSFLEQLVARLPGWEVVQLVGGDVADGDGLLQQVADRLLQLRDAGEPPRVRQQRWLDEADAGVAPVEPATEWGEYLAQVLVDAARGIHGQTGRGVLVTVDDVDCFDAPVARRLIDMACATGQTPALVVFTASDAVQLSVQVPQARRLVWRGLVPLAPDEVAEMLQRSAASAGVRWEPEAIAEVVARAQGSPVRVQLLAEAIWKHAAPRGDDTITAAQAVAGAAGVTAASWW